MEIKSKMVDWVNKVVKECEKKLQVKKLSNVNAENSQSQSFHRNSEKLDNMTNTDLNNTNDVILANDVSTNNCMKNCVSSTTVDYNSLYTIDNTGDQNLKSKRRKANDNIWGRRGSPIFCKKIMNSFAQERSKSRKRSTSKIQQSRGASYLRNTNDIASVRKICHTGGYSSKVNVSPRNNNTGKMLIPLGNSNLNNSNSKKNVQQFRKIIDNDGVIPTRHVEPIISQVTNNGKKSNGVEIGTQTDEKDRYNGRLENQMSHYEDKLLELNKCHTNFIADFTQNANNLQTQNQELRHKLFLKNEESLKQEENKYDMERSFIGKIRSLQEQLERKEEIVVQQKMQNDILTNNVNKLNTQLSNLENSLMLQRDFSQRLSTSAIRDKSPFGCLSCLNSSPRK